MLYSAPMVPAEEMKTKQRSNEERISYFFFVASFSMSSFRHLRKKRTRNEIVTRPLD